MTGSTWQGRVEAEEGEADKTGPLFESKVPLVPLSFLGLGVYRAWIEIVFVRPLPQFPVDRLSLHDLFDAVLVLTLVLCVLLARKIGPFNNKKGVFVFAALSMFAATLSLFLSLYLPAYQELLTYPAICVAGVGIAVTILLFSELYGSINPYRVGIYYSASIVVGALLIYVYKGFMAPWLFAMTLLLPLVAVYGAYRAFKLIPADELPTAQWVTTRLPYKAILVMALYAFAFGMLERSVNFGGFGQHSAPGTMLVGLFVCLAVYLKAERFDANLIYRLALPLAMAAMLLVPFVGVKSYLSGFFISASYTAFSILIMLIFAGICYRYRVSAIWLFGIERSVRLMVMYAGRAFENWLQQTQVLASYGTLAISVLIVASVIISCGILLTEKDFASRWGATFFSDAKTTEEAREHQLFADRCKQISREAGLTLREEMVLHLLLQRKTVGQIEKELIIANGTAKAHVNHIYQKLNVHSRQELYGLFE